MVLAMAEETKKNDILELAPETRLPEEEKTSFLGKLKRGLFMTHTEIIEKVSDAMKDKVTLDDLTIEYLEETLIAADMGVETSLELVERVKKNALREQTTSATKLRKLLSDEVADLLAEMPRPRPLGRGPRADPGGRRQRRRQDDLDRQARPALPAAARAGDARGRRHLPRRRHRATRALGRARWGSR